MFLLVWGLHTITSTPLPFPLPQAPHLFILVLSNLWPPFSLIVVSYICVYMFIHKGMNTATCSVYIVLLVCMFSGWTNQYWITIWCAYLRERLFPHHQHPWFPVVHCLRLGLRVLSPFTFAVVFQLTLRRYVGETSSVQLPTFLGDTITQQHPDPLALAIFPPVFFSVSWALAGGGVVQ